LKKWISQKFSGFENLSYVGGVWNFESAILLQILGDDICNPVVIYDTTIYGKENLLKV
jgi:hypothetical protein